MKLAAAGFTAALALSVPAVDDASPALAIPSIRAYQCGLLAGIELMKEEERERSPLPLEHRDCELLRKAFIALPGSSIPSLERLYQK